MRLLVQLLMLLALVLAVPGGAGAADLSQGHAKKARKCSTFNNWFLWGDPTDCPNDETVPMCADETVVKRARAFVERAEPAYLKVEIDDISHIRELPQTIPLASPLARRYCRADVTLTNGRHTTAYYLIEEDAGFVGISWKIYVCLAGYDEWRVYNGQVCRAARPAVVY